jgi:hypothetical protein
MSINVWGPITWYLFHSLAEKIQDEYFIEEKENILTLFKKVCNCLPCPSCKEHAINSMRKANFKNIKTKKDLKLFLMEFHNIVNSNTNKKIQFTLEQLTDKYKLANINNIVTQFINTYNKPGGNPSVSLSNLLPKKDAINFLISWYSKTQHKFQHFQIKN